MAEHYSPSGGERRKSKRMHAWTRVNIYFEKEWLKGYAADISQEGARVITDKELPIDSHVTLVFPKLPNPRDRVVKASVCWRESRQAKKMDTSIGVKFLQKIPITSAEVPRLSEKLRVI